MTFPVRIREIQAADAPFILDTWRRSIEGSPGVQGAARDHLFTEMARVVSRLSTRPGAVVRVACDPEDEDVICGFISANTSGELHYAYVRRELREQGIIPALLEGLAIDSYTFRTQALERRLRPRVRGWSFTPRFTI